MRQFAAEFFGDAFVEPFLAAGPSRKPPLTDTEYEFAESTIVIDAPRLLGKNIHRRR